MKVLSAIHTDVGTKKTTNQDSACIKIAQTTLGVITMGIICDGMGGLAKGELASATVITTFADWFDNQLADFLVDYQGERILQAWEYMIQQLNQIIINDSRQYG